MHEKTMFVKLNLLLFVFCLHDLFIIPFSINVLSKLPRRLLYYNIKLHFVTIMHDTNLLHTLPL